VPRVLGLLFSWKLSRPPCWYFEKWYIKKEGAMCWILYFEFNKFSLFFFYLYIYIFIIYLFVYLFI